MAETEKVKAAQGGGRRSIDAGMAALAALSVGFFFYAMPGDVARGLVGASSFAEPGSSARYAAVAGAAALAFILVYALLRALGRVPAKARAADLPADPPRIRRADAHPDAPARWPLFAGSELGDPIPVAEASDELELQPEEIFAEEAAVEEPAAEEAEAAEAVERPLPGLLGGVEISDGEPVDRPLEEDAELEHPLPSFIAPAAEDAPAEPFPVEVEAELTPEPAVVEAEAEVFEEPEPEVVEAVEDPIAPEAEEATAEEIPDIDERAAQEDAPVAEVEAEHQAVEEEPAPVAEEEFVPGTWEDPFAEAEPEPSQEPAEEALLPTEYEPVAEPAQVQDAKEEPETVAAMAARILPEPRDESVSDLMGRLEVGLGRRDRAQWMGDPDPASADAPTDDRLRNALGMLKRMAGRKP